MPEIATLHFSTGAEVVNHQFEAWHAAMESVIDVSRPADREQTPGFAASLSAWDLGGMGLVSMRMPGAGYERRWTRQTVGALRLERILRYIRAHLGSARLGVDEIGRVFHLSRSSLYRMFETLGGVEKTITRERIEAAHRALSNGDTRRIHLIGETLGFPDPSSFSRAFRMHVGCAPTEVKEARPRAESRRGPLDSFLEGLG